MAEHHTQGRDGQESRRRKNRKSYGSRHRMPRPEKPEKKKESFVQKVLKFFGFGKKDGKDGDKKKEGKPTPPQKVRVAKTNNKGGNPAARKDRPRRERPQNNQPLRNARLYVGNLSYEATESEIEDLFKGFGNVRSVEIIYNPHTYKSKGYGFVEMQRMDDAQRAVDVLHGQPFMGRELMVRAANERTTNDTEKQQKPDAAKKAEEAPAAEAPAEVPTHAPEQPAEAPAPAPEQPAEAPEGQQ